MSKQFNENQRAWAFTEIASAAEAAKRLCIDACEGIGCENEVEAAYLLAAKMLIEKIGLIADMHGESCVVGGPADWILPPAYHRAQLD